MFRTVRTISALLPSAREGRSADYDATNGTRAVIGLHWRPSHRIHPWSRAVRPKVRSASAPIARPGQRLFVQYEPTKPFPRMEIDMGVLSDYDADETGENTERDGAKNSRCGTRVCVPEVARESAAEQGRCGLTEDNDSTTWSEYQLTIP